jgi:acyl-coenzyme A thioesterase PaaI-like protein
VRVFDRTEKRQVGTRSITTPERVVSRVGIGSGGWILLILAAAAGAAIAHRLTFNYHLKKLGTETH